MKTSGKTNRSKWLSMLLGGVLATGLTAGLATSSQASSFIDTQGHWASSDIDRWASHNVVNGYSTTLFGPDNAITRGEMAVMLDKIMRYQVSDNKNFTDLPFDAYYTDAIQKLSAAGIMDGDPTGRVRPTDPITREEAAVVLANALHLDLSSYSYGNGYYTFADHNKISFWALDAVYAMNYQGYLNGRPDNTVDPGSNITRGEFAKILNTAIGLYIDAEGSYPYGTDRNVDSVVINTGGVTLDGCRIYGDLIIAEGVANGSVNLRNLEVGGDIIIKGGASSSINMTNVKSTGNLIVDRVDASVRVNFSGDCSFAQVQVENDCILDTRSMTDHETLGRLYINSGYDVALYGDYEEVVNNSYGVRLSVLGTIHDSLTMSKSGMVNGVAFDAGKKLTSSEIPNSSGTVVTGIATNFSNVTASNPSVVAKVTNVSATDSLGYITATVSISSLNNCALPIYSFDAISTLVSSTGAVIPSTVYALSSSDAGAVYTVRFSASAASSVTFVVNLVDEYVENTVTMLAPTRGSYSLYEYDANYVDGCGALVATVSSKDGATLVELDGYENYIVKATSIAGYYGRVAVNGYAMDHFGTFFNTSNLIDQFGTSSLIMDMEYVEYTGNTEDTTIDWAITVDGEATTYDFDDVVLTQNIVDLGIGEFSAEVILNTTFLDENGLSLESVDSITMDSNYLSHKSVINNTEDEIDLIVYPTVKGETVKMTMDFKSDGTLEEAEEYTLTLKAPDEESYKVSYIKNETPGSHTVQSGGEKEIITLTGGTSITISTESDKVGTLSIDGKSEGNLKKGDTYTYTLNSNDVIWVEFGTTAPETPDEETPEEPEAETETTATVTVKKEGTVSTETVEAKVELDTGTATITMDVPTYDGYTLNINTGVSVDTTGYTVSSKKIENGVLTIEVSKVNEGDKIEISLNYTANEYSLTYASDSDSDAGGTFEVKIDGEEDEDTIEKAKTDDTVVITVSPDSDKEVDKVQYKFRNGTIMETKDIALTVDCYSFTMPAADCDIIVTFKNIELKYLTVKAINNDAADGETNIIGTFYQNSDCVKTKWEAGTGDNENTVTITYDWFDSFSEFGKDKYQADYDDPIKENHYGNVKVGGKLFAGDVEFTGSGSVKTITLTGVIRETDEITFDLYYKVKTS